MRWTSTADTVKQLNQQGVDEALSDFDEELAGHQEKQAQAPWHREGVDQPPVRRQRSASAMVKGERSSNSG